ncbi:hypothetical protein FHS18_001154 [Paenibacillus phyllosphaerae]|uniref:Fibronectin type-III domain-containing protein n=1 Tax=Paenibacillus phyllosphaerae TaxID=274593 RepID=A0A7W5AUV8_9BACL|nr:kelch repeat-containing protein [Paenibacillus phyllosphaerae]MBB3109102.1 hypothetical protein [Paenibacillus phyllosphaerae]
MNLLSKVMKIMLAVSLTFGIILTDIVFQQKSAFAEETNVEYGNPFFSGISGGQITLPNGNIQILRTDLSPTIYDPYQKVFKFGGEIPDIRSGFSSSLLLSGKVLVVGGIISGQSTYTKTNFIYDPNTRTSTMVASSVNNYSGRAQSTLADGKVMVTGGYGSSYYSTVEIYDPVSNTWSTGQALPASLAFHSQLTLPDGRVIVTGGKLSSSVRNSVIYIFDPSSGTWTNGGNLPVAVSSNNLSLLQDGTVFITGGADSTDAKKNSAIAYDPNTRQIRTLANLPEVISGHKQSTLANGDVMITGNKVYYIYDYKLDKWTKGHPNSYPAHKNISSLPDGNLLMTGGTSNKSYSYNPINGTYVEKAAFPTTLNSYGQSTLQNGKVFVTGGENGSVFTNTYLYDLTANTWTAAASLPIPLMSHAQTTLSDGRVIVTGGYRGDTKVNSNKTYIYNPANNTWAVASDIPSTLIKHTQSVLSDGRLMVTSTNKICYIYDVKLNTWLQIASVPQTFTLKHTQVTLESGEVIVIQRSAYQYNPSTNQWVTLPNYDAILATNTMINLGDGRLRVFGDDSDVQTMRELIFKQTPEISPNIVQVNVSGAQTTFKITGKARSKYMNTTAISATIDGVTKTTTVAKTPMAYPASDNWELVWDVEKDNIAPGKYTNFDVVAKNSYNDTMTVPYVGVINVDQESPQIAETTITVNNQKPTYINAGDVITLMFKANEEIQLPTVKIQGNAAAVTLAGQNAYRAVYQLKATDSEGPILFEINYFDATGNAGYPITTTTDGYTPFYSRSVLSPTDLVAQSKTDTQVVLTWKAPVKIDGISGYDVYQDDVKIGSVTSVSTVTYTAKLLKPSTTYRFNVKAKTAQGKESETSNILIVTTTSDLTELDDSFAGAIMIRENLTYTAYINKETDVDYYRYTASSSGIDQINLSMLAASDFNVYVYDQNMRPLNAGISATGVKEEVLFKVTQGSIYYIKVERAGGTFSAAPYTLQVNNPVVQYQTTYEYDKNGNIKKKTTTVVGG